MLVTKNILRVARNVYSQIGSVVVSWLAVLGRQNITHV